VHLDFMNKVCHRWCQFSGLAQVWRSTLCLAHAGKGVGFGTFEQLSKVHACLTGTECLEKKIMTRKIWIQIRPEN